MRSRVSLFALLITTGLLVLPVVAHAAAIPFFGPIIPQGGNDAVCPAGWGMVIVVINNIITFAITMVIVFIAPLMIGYAGFLYVVNPVDPSGLSKAKGILLNTIVGIVIALAGWMIVAAIMAVLYNPNGQTKLEAWADIIGSHGAPSCITQKGALPGEVLAPAVTAPGVVVVPGAPGVPGAGGKFTFRSGISAQVRDESGPLASLLSCMEAKVPAGVGDISSISDCVILGNCEKPKPQKTFAECSAGGTAAGCSHAANSCHYGGRKCVGQSYAVDFGDEQNTQALSDAASACGANYIGNEDNHLHVSVGASCECN